MIGSGHIMPLIIENLDHVIAKVGGKDVVSSLLLISIAIESVVRQRATGVNRVHLIGTVIRSFGVIDHQWSLIHGYLGICAPSIQSAVLGEKDKLGGARETFGNPGRRIYSKIHG